MKKIPLLVTIFVLVSCGRYVYVGRAHTNQLWTVKGIFYGQKEWFLDIMKSEKKPLVEVTFPLPDDLLFNRESLDRPGYPRVVVLYAMNHKSRYWLKVTALSGPNFDLVTEITRNKDTVRVFFAGKATPYVFCWVPAKPKTDERWVLL